MLAEFLLFLFLGLTNWFIVHIALFAKKKIYIYIMATFEVEVPAPKVMKSAAYVFSFLAKTKKDSAMKCN